MFTLHIFLPAVQPPPVGARNVQIEMKVILEHAPADYTVNGNSIIGMEKEFTFVELTKTFKVY